MRNGPAILIAAALVAGLVYASWGPPRDAPTLLPPEPRAAAPAAPRRAKPAPAERPWRLPRGPAAHAATLVVPALGLRDRVSLDLDAGPAFWPVTGRPGGGDTVAIAGHRTTHTAPFLRLDRLRPGNRVYVLYGGRAYAYEVVRTRIRPASDLHIADAVGRERLLLTACSRADGSPTSLSYRIVVYARPLP